MTKLLSMNDLEDFKRIVDAEALTADEVDSVLATLTDPKSKRGFYQGIDTVLALLQVIPTEDYRNAEEYRKELYRQVMEIKYND